MREYRAELKDAFGVPHDYELHARKLVSGRGGFPKGRSARRRSERARIFRGMLERLHWLERDSIITCAGPRGCRVYDDHGPEAVLAALLQRLERSNAFTRHRGLLYFDDGHREYEEMSERALKSMKVGLYGRGGPWMNKPMRSFIERGSPRESHRCPFTQTADLVVYAARMKLAHEAGTILDWQRNHGLHEAYECLPPGVINRKATQKHEDGIVRLENYQERRRRAGSIK